MKRYLLLPFFVMIFLFCACAQKYTDPVVLIKTQMGDIKVKLYNETPLHRDNFIKMVKNGVLDHTLFHRVIKNFMIQGGDPDSKEAVTGAALGKGGPGYTLPSEINFPKFFHKRGALAAARQPDKVNPEKRSSGSQFYIVQGERFDDGKLTKIENQQREGRRRNIFNQLLTEYNDSLNYLQQNGDQKKLLLMQQKIMAEVQKRYSDQPEFSFPEEVKEIYRTIGGTPHLDGNYTVFGEIIEDKTIIESIQSLFGKKFGIEVVDAIANSETDSRNRPLKDIIMEVKLLKD